MIPARSLNALRALALATSALFGLACDTGGDLPLCLDPVPEGGCPIGRGGTCDDVSCNGLYDCVDRRWTLQVRCSNGAGGAGGGGSGGGPSAGTGGTCTPVVIDHQGETIGCKPDLEHPDCPIQVAETCAETACLSSCVDFFLCTKDGWIARAYCDDQGTLIVEP